MGYHFLLLLITVLPALILAIYRPVYFKELFLDLRLGRILHYFILFLFGIVLCKETFMNLNETDLPFWLKSILYFFVLVYGAVFAIASNNKEDLPVDKISNKNRPLVRNSVDPIIYMRIARLSLLFSLILATLIGWEFLITISSISFIYFVYSCRPFKLKRFVFLAKFLIGLNSFISALCGYYFAGGQIQDFPTFWAVFILIPVSLMANFVDLKDTEGDKIVGVKTLPVLFGLSKAKFLIAGFTVSTYLMVYFYFVSSWISILLVLTSIVHLYLLFRQPYVEKPLFLLHNSLFIGLIMLILIDQSI